MWRVEDGGEKFTVLGAPGWELSLVAMPAELAAGVKIADPPNPRENAPTKLSLEVASIETVVPLLREAGGQIDPGSEEWRFRRWRHLDCLDPEGNVLQVREPLEPTLAGRELTGRDFGGQAMAKTSFVGSNLTMARFAGADLAGASFVDANLTRADFEGATLDRASLDDANLTWASFAEARLDGATFADSNLTRTSFARATATGANFYGSNLTRCDLSGADLRGADLCLVGLNYANVDGADLDGADLSGAIGVRMFGEPKRLPDGWSLIDGCLVEDA
jgi:uncharacterized protein YjbI with pentapeptide repeats